MTFSRRLRITYLIFIGLAQKYTVALIGGCIIGLALSVMVFRFAPVVLQHWFTPVQRIGLVGEFTPNTLPLLIQKDISVGLTTISEDGSPLPGLASSWTATDSGKTFTFTLREDMAWHKGKPVVADDVNYNIKNVTFTALDPHTLKATLEDPYSPFPTLLSKPLFLSGLRGLGAYSLSGIRLNGDNLRYLKLVPTERNNRVKEYRFYRTEAAGILAYKLGEIDELEDMTSAYDMNMWRGTTVTENVKYNRIVALFFNFNDGNLQDKSFRQGLAYAVPELEGDRAYSPISQSSWAYTDKVKKYSYDPVLAKRLLNISKSSTESAALTLSTFAQYESVAESIANSWTSMGVETTVKIITAVPSDYQVLLSAQDLPPDPDLYPFWHSTQNMANQTGYVNVKIDKLLEDGRQELDTEKRKTVYADFQRRLVDDVPAVFLYYQKVFRISRN